MTLQLFLDAVITVLLAVFIGYAILLSRQLKDLRRNRDEMARIITTFNEATARAEAGIPRLRKTAEEAGRTLEESVAKARALRDDLAYMVERADGMAARLESSVRSARGGEGKAPASAASLSTPRPEPRLDARNDLRPEPRSDLRATDRLDLLAGGEHDDRLAQARPRVRPVRPDPRLQALAGGPDGAGHEEGPESGLGEDERSEAERELLRALRAVR
ncbi:DUF6468 domain-containing protein [Pararhodospirillum photometricum]|uniref:DUF6468 domain-containing protein n=1 Tax=Pararhodospirillum photometricum DSM 122 TaxID=1150469 RepID=H6SME8_PARPM|nr:DUF6468 domain-containing protein [Pararhodospirillum photometricum]CCG06831.1 Putative uncharacterized protein [Pararhodospirillum photometricum DSM 122]